MPIPAIMRKIHNFIFIILFYFYMNKQSIKLWTNTGPQLLKFPCYKLTSKGTTTTPLQTHLPKSELQNTEPQLLKLPELQTDPLQEN